MIADLRVFCFSNMDAFVGIRYGMRARGTLVNKVDYNPEYADVAREKGHTARTEAITAADPTFKVSISGKVLRLAGTINAVSPMTAFHKSYIADVYPDVEHGFGITAATDGYFIGTGKLSAPPGKLSEVTMELEWFTPANDTFTKVAAPSVP